MLVVIVAAVAIILWLLDNKRCADKSLARYLGLHCDSHGRVYATILVPGEAILETGEVVATDCLDINTLCKGTIRPTDTGLMLVNTITLGELRQ